MIYVVAALALGALILMLVPFVQKKTGFETLDALEYFEAHLAILVCLGIFAMKPNGFTAVIALLAIGLRALPRQKPSQIFLRSMTLIAVAVVWLQTTT